MKSLFMKYTIVLNIIGPINEGNKGCKDMAHAYYRAYCRVSAVTGRAVLYRDMASIN
jgi:hypothetical protein